MFGSTADCSCDLDCDATHGACEDDGHCDDYCPAGADPNCATCDCDYFSSICEAAEIGSTAECTCDPDCAGPAGACEADGHCDSWCPAAADPDCSCDCDYFPDVCEAAVNGSDTDCPCDGDCVGGAHACEAEGHCDTWCDPGGICVDPDCTGAEGSGFLTGNCIRF
jgi:hypothetical protein